MKMDVNLATEKCLKTATYIGYDRIHNVCKGTFLDVPWGTADWFGACFVAAIVTVIILLMLAMLVAMTRTMIFD